MEINKSLNSKERDIFKQGKVNWKELKNLHKNGRGVL